MITCKYKNIQIWKYTNIHLEKYKREKFKRVCIENNIQNVNKETNKPNKEKIYESNKYKETHVEKYLFGIIKEYIKTRKYKTM